jgi:hypothetical protein
MGFDGKDTITSLQGDTIQVSRGTGSSFIPLNISVQTVVVSFVQTVLIH